MGWSGKTGMRLFKLVQIKGQRCSGVDSLDNRNCLLSACMLCILPVGYGTLRIMKSRVGSGSCMES